MARPFAQPLDLRRSKWHQTRTLGWREQGTILPSSARCAADGRIDSPTVSRGLQISGRALPVSAALPSRGQYTHWSGAQGGTQPQVLVKEVKNRKCFTVH